MNSSAPVLVAVDGSDHSLRALRWAREAARLRDTGVLAAHVRSGRGADPVRDRVEAEGGVSYVAVEGSPAAALCELAAKAQLLVLGSRGLGGFAALLLGSNGRKCAAHAPCPVVVVPHASRAEDAVPPAGRERHDRVVLGLDPEETADDVIEFAYAEADRRRAELQVISTHFVPITALTVVGEFVPGGDAADAPSAGLALTAGQRERLAEYAERYPSVVVDPVVAPGDPAGRLVTASGRADLVVVGRHRRRLRPEALPLGSVTNAVLSHAHAPVAVVPGR